MVIPILRDICEYLRAVDATRKARLCYDIYGSGKDPFSERMGWQFLTAFIIRNHLRMSGGSPKHVKLRHRTLLLSAKHIGNGSRVRALVNPPYFQTETLPTLSMR